MLALESSRIGIFNGMLRHTCGLTGLRRNRLSTGRAQLRRRPGVGSYAKKEIIALRRYAVTRALRISREVKDQTKNGKGGRRKERPVHTKYMRTHEIATTHECIIIIIIM